MQSRRISGSTSTHSSADKGKHSSSDRGRNRVEDQVGGQPTSHCEDCKFRTHPDFNERGQWDGSLADRTMPRWQNVEKEIKLIWAKRADGTVLPRRVPDAANPAASPRQNADDRDPQRRRDNDRRDRDGDRRDQGGRGGRGQVYWGNDKGTPCLTSIITHLTCNCGGADIVNA